MVARCWVKGEGSRRREGLAKGKEGWVREVKLMVALLVAA